MNLGKRTGLLLLALAVLWAVLPLAVKAEDGVVLDEITVKGEAITTESQPITVDVVDKEKIQELKIREPEKILEEVPGIDIHRYGMGGVANEFTIRGFNNAGHGGDAAIAIDGIILNEGQSHADGYADMNVIIPLELDHVEVFKGPSSPLFGNFARGGAISFFTRKTGVQRGMSNRVLAFLRRAARAGCRVIVGDPERAFLPRHLFVALARMEIPVTQALESTDVKSTTVWELPPALSQPRPSGRATTDAPPASGR